MAVLPMKRVVICALKKDRKPILELLQRMGTVQVEKGSLQDDVFSKQDRSDARAVFQKNAATASQALEVLGTYAPAEGGLAALIAGRKAVSVEEYGKRVGRRDEILQTCRKILDLEKERAESAAAIPKMQSQAVALEPWLAYDLPLNCPGTKDTVFFTGTFPNETSLESLCTKLALYAPQAEKVDVQIISASQEQTCAMIVSAKSDAEAVQDALRKMEFAKAPVTSVNPAEALKTLRQDIEQLEKYTADLAEQIRSFAPQREDIEFAVDYFNMRADKYDVISQLSQSRSTFVLEGYTPEPGAEKLKDALESQFDVLVDFAEPEESEDVPILLKNGPLAEPVEPIVESYSLPNRHELDPSTLVACFYYLLFGMMLSDAAYGIIMTIGCAVALKKMRDLSPGIRKALKMFFYCGISTIVFGFLFGSFFGDAVNVIATTFFNRPDISLPALWFEPIDKPMKMLAFCFAVGVVHLFVGLGAKLYGCIRSGKILDGIYDVVFWYMLVGGAIVYLLSVPTFTEMMGLPFAVSAQAGKVVGWIAVVGAVGIILTAGRDSRNWFKRILKGLYGVYGITGYLSDILSYSRLLALGLATSVIATVFNKMGSMLGGGVIGAIVFIIVFVIGHILNLAINAMGAYVHTNRLQFVEFFGKFYEGGGRKFEPFAVHTKYFKFREENET